jgi:peptidyl-prolyl cis-trans isomerase C
LKIDDDAAKKFYGEHKKEFEKPGMTTVAHILMRPERLSPEKAKGMSDADKEAFMKASDEKAKKKAETVLAEINKDASNFAELAKKNSACPSSAEGGNLPPFDENGMTARGPMDKAFTAAAMALKKKGDVSGVVKSPFGYHIIKLLDRTEKSCVPFDDVKGKLKKYLESQALDKKIPSLIDAEKKKLGVKIFVK